MTSPHGRTCSGRSIEIAPLATWFVMTEILGKRNVKNYDGSWTEYGSLVGVTVEVGNGQASGDVRLGINELDIVLWPERLATLAASPSAAAGRPWFRAMARDVSGRIADLVARHDCHSTAPRSQDSCHNDSRPLLSCMIAMTTSSAALSTCGLPAIHARIRCRESFAASPRICRITTGMRTEIDPTAINTAMTATSAVVEISDSTMVSAPITAHDTSMGLSRNSPRPSAVVRSRGELVN